MGLAIAKLQKKFGEDCTQEVFGMEYSMIGTGGKLGRYGGGAIVAVDGILKDFTTGDWIDEILGCGPLWIQW